LYHSSGGLELEELAPILATLLRIDGTRATAPAPCLVSRCGSRAALTPRPTGAEGSCTRWELGQLLKATMLATAGCRSPAGASLLTGSLLPPASAHRCCFFASQTDGGAPRQLAASAGCNTAGGATQARGCGEMARVHGNTGRQSTGAAPVQRGPPAAAPRLASIAGAHPRSTIGKCHRAARP
jgi:hypothetical protein